MTSTLRRLPRRREDARIYDKELRSYLMVPDQAVAHELNPTARAVWELCDGTTTVDELADAICRVFQVARTQALSDVQVVVEQLGEAGLVTWSAPLEEAEL